MTARRAPSRGAISVTRITPTAKANTNTTNVYAIPARDAVRQSIKRESRASNGMLFLWTETSWLVRARQHQPRSYRRPGTLDWQKCNRHGGNPRSNLWRSITPRQIQFQHGSFSMECAHTLRWAAGEHL